MASHNYLYKEKNQQSSIHLPYISGLDGIRAIAVMAVIFYHGNFSWALGGFLGVETFFVLSGFLITSLLLCEWNKTGAINLTNFWLRRARRLLPALWFFLLILPLLTYLLAPDALARLWEDMIPALTYVINWYYVIREISYFDHFGRTPLLQHLWSLSVEEQFYVLWPLFFFFLMKFFQKTKSKLMPIAISLLIASSAIWMFILYEPNSDPSRVYYGADTRAAGFLIGALLAFFWKPWRLSKRPKPSALHRYLLEGFGFVIFFLTLAIYSRINEFQTSLYQGGMVCISIVNAFLIVNGSQPKTILNKFFEIPIMRWIGKRSYGIYLWHWPIFSFARPGYDVAFPALPLFIIKLLLTFGIAEISYQLIEQPIRQHGFKQYFHNHFRNLGKNTFSTIFIILTGLFLILDLGSLYLVQNQTNLSILPSLVETPSTLSAASSQNISQFKSPIPDNLQFTQSVTAPPVSVDHTPTIQTEVQISMTPELDTTKSYDLPDIFTPTPEAIIYTLTFIGDSVMEGAEDIIRSSLEENIYFDAEQSRNFEDLPLLVQELSEQGTLAPTVIIHLGTNRLFEEKVFAQSVSALLAHDVNRILIVNVHRPIRWEDLANKRLEEGVRLWEEVELLDWHTLSKDYPGWFGEDQVHLTTYGKNAYVNLILYGLRTQEP